MFLNLTPIFRDPREEGECNISVLFVLFTHSINLFISILKCGGTTVISDCVWEFHFPPTSTGEIFAPKARNACDGFKMNKPQESHILIGVFKSTLFFLKELLFNCIKDKIMPSKTIFFWLGEFSELFSCCALIKTYQT